MKPSFVRTVSRKQALRLYVYLLLAFMTATTLAQEAPPVETPAPETPVERAAWEPSIQKVFSQLNTLDLFAAATSLGGMTVKVPRELQKIPMQMIEGSEELRNRGIEIYVTELKFRDLKFNYEQSPKWTDEKPLIPTLSEFGKLGLSAEAKTKVGTIPIGATFDNGKIPVEFLPVLDKGYDLKMLPESRAEETRLDEVDLKVGGGITSGIANLFLSKKVGKLILQYGVGQTLQMGQGDLLRGDTASRLLDIPADSAKGRAVGTLLDLLK